MEELNLVKVCEVPSEYDAQLYSSALEEQGIKVMVKGLDVSAFGDVLDGIDAIELFVDSKLLQKAQGIVAELAAEPEEPVPAWTCECGEEVDEGFGVCWSCQAEYKGE